MNRSKRIEGQFSDPLPSSGQSNEELTTRVEDFVDRMIAVDDNASLWDFFPALSIASASAFVYELWRRYRRNEIISAQFKNYAAAATGLKVSKIAGLMFLLTVPVVGQVTGPLLVANLLLNAKKTWFERPLLNVPQLQLLPERAQEFCNIVFKLLSRSKIVAANDPVHIAVLQ